MAHSWLTLALGSYRERSELLISSFSLFLLAAKLHRYQLGSPFLILARFLLCWLCNKSSLVCPELICLLYLSHQLSIDPCRLIRPPEHVVVLLKSGIKWSQDSTRVFTGIAVLEFESLLGIVAFLNKLCLVSCVLEITGVGLHVLLVVEGHIVVGHGMVQLGVTNQVDTSSDSGTALVDILPLCLLLQQVGVGILQGHIGLCLF